MARLVAPVVELSGKVEEIPLPQFYYGDYGIFGLKKALRKVAKLPKKTFKVTKKVVTSTPFKIAAGAALVATAAPAVVGAVTGAGAGTAAGAGAGAEAGAGAGAGAGAVGAGAAAAGAGAALAAGKMALDTALQYKLAKEQMKLMEEQAKAQQAMTVFPASESTFNQQALTQQLAAQQVPIVDGRMMMTGGGYPVSPVQQSNDNLMKYALIGGGALLLALLLVNRD